MAATIMGALQNKSATNPGEDFAQQNAELQGADPGLMLKQLDQINKLLGVLFVQTFQRLPNVANNISLTMKQLSRAIKEAQQASSVGDVLKKNPINQSMVNNVGPAASPDNTGGANG